MPEAQRAVSALEFLRWRLLLQLEEEDRHREEWERPRRADHYAAQTAYWVYVLYHRVTHMFDDKPPSPDFKSEDFLIKFGKAAKPVDTRTPEQRAKDKAEYRETMLTLTKARWFSGVGLDKAHPAAGRPQPPA